MTDNDIAIGGPADGGVNPESFDQAKPSFLGSTRKYSVGNGTIRLGANTVTNLPTVPGEAQSCILVLEAAPGANKANALGRFWCDGSWPNAVEGLPMYHGSVIEIISKEDLTRMRMVSTDNLHHKVNIQYYSGI